MKHRLGTESSQIQRGFAAQLRAGRCCAQAPLTTVRCATERPMSLVREGLRIRSLIVVLWRASLRDPRTDRRATLDPCFSTRATPDPRT
jgi:hypothetical protein